MICEICLEEITDENFRHVDIDEKGNRKPVHEECLDEARFNLIGDY